MKQLRKSDIKDLNQKLEQYEIVLDKKTKVQADKGQVGKKINAEFYFINDQVSFVKVEDKLFPTLKYILNHQVIESKLKSVIVDMGAVRFVTSGADIMRPGICEFNDSLEVGDIVVIYDVNNKKPLAIGEMLMSSKEMSDSSSGKSVKNLHYIGDSLWSL